MALIQIDLQKTLHGAGGDLSLDISTGIDAGEFICLYGASGTGKTSTLRMVAGLMRPDQGNIIVNGTPWYSSSDSINWKPQQRAVGYVFQDYALFPNMTVKENLNYALSKQQSQSMVTELLEVMDLIDLQHRKPNTLSGGQQQRTALARALVNKPQLLLLDEPLSALDPQMRSALQDYIIQMHKSYGLTTIMVTHDIGEIFKMADRVLELADGKIKQSGPPTILFSSQSVSGKFQFTGEVLSIVKEDIIYIISVLIGNNMVKVVADEKEASQLAVGDKVLVASKAFNPLIRKLH
ncbi:MAG: ABC transporter ATP-binding protein [Bacteroidota bacterium]